MRIPLNLFAGLVAVAAAVPAAAQHDAACWNRNLEQLDYDMNPPDGGDNEFFTGVSQPGNVVAAFMNRKPMLQFPHTIYEIRTDRGGPAYPPVVGETGCENPFLDALTYFYREVPALQGAYSAAKTYPPPEFTYGTDPGSSAFKLLFRTDSYYRFLDWDSQCKASSGVCKPQTAANACSFAGTRTAECTTCVTTKGYWLNPDIEPWKNQDSSGVFAGNWLNFYPQRFVMLRFALRRVAQTPLLKGLRMAAVTNKDGGGMDVFTGSGKSKKFLPSCAGSGDPVNAVLNGIDGVEFLDDHNPIAEVLFNIGQYVSRKGRYFPGPDPLFTTSSVVNSAYDEGSGNSRSICRDCEKNFILLFSDGRGDEGNPYCNPGPGPATAPCLSNDKCNNEGMGLEDDGADYITSSNTPDITGAGARQTPAGTCEREYADDVARFLNETDFNPDSGYPSKNSITTYVVGVGSDRYNRMTALEEIAKAGDGLFLKASNYSDLEDGLKALFEDIIRRATSFSVAAITTVQTRGTTFAFIPRFRPDTENRWEGRLLRFKLFNEFAAGCTEADTAVPMTAAKLTRNLNGDTDCADVFLLDRDNDFIAENDDGVFMKQNRDTSTTPATFTLTVSPAVPVWDAAEFGDGSTWQGLSSLDFSAGVPGLFPAVSDKPAAARQIYTVVDTDDDGVFEPGEQIEFNLANLAALKPYLALGAVTGEFCTGLSLRTETTYATDDDCASEVIRFLHGMDVMDEDDDGVKAEPRPKILGDIFHSSPVLVTAPPPQFLCDLGVSNQCVFSLYSSRLTPGGAAAYTAYSALQQNRDQFVVVGANDGMIHAFHAGTIRTGDDPETPATESPSNRYFDLGTGRELWAFIPPDLLPKLKRYLINGRHELMMDGTAMVRDVWVDGSTNPKVKDATEYHTLAIFGQRQGGRHNTALDVTNPAAPAYRWTFPKPGRTFGMALGESWNDHAPSAPPIGPVAFAETDGPLSCGATGCATAAGPGGNARERYIVALNGGNDTHMVRGRAVYMLDAWTGDEVWRFARIDSSGPADPRHHIFPVASTVGMVDLGPGPNSVGPQDGLFDTALVGDLAGQMWVFRFFAPGEDSNSDGRADNWFGGRVFEQFKGLPLRHKSPFYQLPAATILLQGGAVRVYAGTGDRLNIRDRNGGDCGLVNLGACVRKDCTTEVVTTYNKNGVVFAHGTWKYTAAGTALTTNTFTVDSAGVTSSCSDLVRGDYTVNVNCGAAQAFNYAACCDWDATNPSDCDSLSSSALMCPIENARPTGTRIDKTYTTTNARFYSIKLFDSSTRAPFTTFATAQSYDNARLTDGDLVNADLATSDSGGPGWFVGYAQQNERTASGTNLLSGCVIWNTLEPAAAAATCGVVQGDNARQYLGHHVTGATSCGSVPTTSRFTLRTSVVPPPMPTPVVSVNPVTGEVRYSVISLEPGAAPAQQSVGQSDILGTIHWLEVPRQLHRCRHVSGVNCQ